MAGVELDDLGCRQMAACVDCIPADVATIQCSPQRRAQQSASILAWHLDAHVEIVEAVNEIDLGDWTGRPFDELHHDPDWIAWNEQRGAYTPPRGESMQGLQDRVVHHIESLRSVFDDCAILIVSHAEPIRAALLHYANIPLDNFLSISVDPASISTVRFHRTGAYISRINEKVPV